MNHSFKIIKMWARILVHQGQKAAGMQPNMWRWTACGRRGVLILITWDNLQ